MKKRLTLLTLLLCSLQVSAQKNLTEEIDRSLKGLKAILKMTGMRIEISAGDSKFDPSSSFTFEKPRTLGVGNEKLDSFFQNLDVQTSSVYPYSLLSIDKDKYKLTDLLGQESSYFMNNAAMEPRFTPLSFTFADGSTVKANADNYIGKPMLANKYRTTEKDEDGTSYDVVAEDKMSEAEKLIWNASSFNSDILVKSPKPLKSVAFSIDLPVREMKSYEPTQREVRTPFGNIKIDTIVGNRVYCMIPETEQKDAITIQAYYKDGRILKQKSYSATTYLTPAKRKYYEFYVTILEKAREEVAQKRIKTEAQLKAFAEAQIKANPEEEADMAKYKAAVYTFAGPVSKVDFLVSDTTSSDKQFSTTSNFRHENNDYFLAQELGKDSVGLLNQQGKWIVEPRMSPYFRPWNNYYYRDQINDYDVTYWFDPKAKKLVKTDYKIDDPEVYDGKYIKIEPETNGLNGLADVTTGEIVLPMKYDNLQFKGNRFWVGRLDEKKGALNRDLKTVLPFAFDRVEADENFLYTNEEGGKENVYTATGTRITNNKYDGIEGMYSNNLLLVYESVKEPNGDFRTHYTYIDPQGKVKLDLKDFDFTDRRPFSAGMAAVEDKSGKWGFMNTAGKVIIPCQFKWVFSFYPTSGFAEVELTDESVVLIDKTGNVIKRFGESIYKRERSPEDRASRIYGRDDTIWNEYGEVVER